jgi:hypothetical protein
MPKYYISFLSNKYVLSAKDPIEACVKVCKRYSVITVGIDWKVSEQGFNFHETDEFVSDKIINDKLNK